MANEFQRLFMEDEELDLVDQEFRIFVTEREHDRVEAATAAEERREVQRIQNELICDQRRVDERVDENRIYKSGKLIKLGLPNFREEDSELTHYLLRFERICKRMEVPQQDWGLYLSRLLEGKALEVYGRLSDEDADNYEVLKMNLMKRFRLTESEYKRRYKNSKLDVGETHPQFVERLKRSLDRWRESAELGANYEGLQELVLKDRYLETCSVELQIFIKEKGHCSLKRMAEYAEIYVEAHAPRESYETEEE